MSVFKDFANLENLEKKFKDIQGKCIYTVNFASIPNGTATF